MNSGLARNSLSIFLGIAIAFLLVLKPWLGFASAIGAGMIYYRSVRDGLRRRHLFTKSRAGRIADPDLLNSENPNIEPATAYLNRGRSLLDRRDYVLAIGDFDRVIWVDSDCRVAYYLRAVCLLAIGESEQAAIDLEIAQDLARQQSDQKLLADIETTLATMPQQSLLEMAVGSSSSLDPMTANSMRIEPNQQ